METVASWYRHPVSLCFLCVHTLIIYKVESNEFSVKKVECVCERVNSLENSHGFFYFSDEGNEYIVYAKLGLLLSIHMSLQIKGLYLSDIRVRSRY